MDTDITTLTASIGIATFPDHAPDPEALFRAADRAMYRIKFGGKNGVAAA
jgi:diguanylate cyclase (GGDEF)-like protein